MSDHPVDCGALVPVPGEQAHEYARLQIEIEIRKHFIADLQADRDWLERTLTTFAVELRSRVGSLRSELSRVRRQVAEYLRRIERLRENDLLDPNQVEQEVADEFAERLEQERLADEQAAREGQRIAMDRPKVRLDPEIEAEILRLYRELAKRFHPDRSRNETERVRRTDMMLRINVAYSDRDLLTLQSIARTAETSEPAATVITPEERVQWAQRVIARQTMQIEELRQQIELLRESETFQMWQSPETSAESISQVERRVKDRLNRERDKLDHAIIDYNRLVRRRRLSHITLEPHFASSPGE